MLYVPARRQPVWPAPSESLSFCAVRYGLAALPTAASDPDGDATRSHRRHWTQSSQRRGRQPVRRRPGARDIRTCGDRSDSRSGSSTVVHRRGSGRSLATGRPCSVRRRRTAPPHPAPRARIAIPVTGDAGGASVTPPARPRSSARPPLADRKATGLTSPPEPTGRSSASVRSVVAEPWVAACARAAGAGTTSRAATANRRRTSCARVSEPPAPIVDRNARRRIAGARWGVRRAHPHTDNVNDLGRCSTDVPSTATCA